MGHTEKIYYKLKGTNKHQVRLKKNEPCKRVFKLSTKHARSMFPYVHNIINIFMETGHECSYEIV